MHNFVALGSSLMPYFCSCCLANIFPSQFLDNAELRTVLPESMNISTSSSNIFSTFNSNQNHYCSIKECSTVFHDSKNFMIMHVNTRSLHKNFEKREELIHEINITPDVIAISETKLKDNTPFSYSLFGYDFVSKNSSTNAGGVEIFVIPTSKVINLTTSLNLNVSDCADLRIEIMLPQKRKCFVGAVYRHPNYNFSQFLNSFELTVAKLTESKSHYNISGDINIDLLNCDKESIKNYQATLLSLGCKQMIQHATRVSSHSSSLIDRFYSNNTSNEICYRILLSALSDHFPTISAIKGPKPIKKNMSSYVRNTKNFVAEDFLNDLYLNLESDESKSSITNVNHLCDSFINTFEKTLNQHAPFRKLTRKEQKLNKKPWLSKGIIKSIQTRNDLYKMTLSNNSPELLDEYRLYRNELTHVKEQAKKRYYSNQINEAQHNSGLIWKTINDIVTYKNTKSQSITSLKNEEGKLIQNPLLIADTFNEYFS